MGRIDGEAFGGRSRGSKALRPDAAMQQLPPMFGVDERRGSVGTSSMEHRHRSRKASCATCRETGAIFPRRAGPRCRPRRIINERTVLRTPSWRIRPSIGAARLMLHVVTALISLWMTSALPLGIRIHFSNAPASRLQETLWKTASDLVGL